MSRRQLEMKRSREVRRPGGGVQEEDLCWKRVKGSVEGGLGSRLKKSAWRRRRRKNCSMSNRDWCWLICGCRGTKVSPLLRTDRSSSVSGRSGETVNMWQGSVWLSPLGLLAVEAVGGAMRSSAVGGVLSAVGGSGWAAAAAVRVVCEVLSLEVEVVSAAAVPEVVWPAEADVTSSVGSPAVSSCSMAAGQWICWSCTQRNASLINTN
ncbi:uncharacterized protein LOC132209065 isoform X1 [Stegostoma tigrinum]|uniref:uncharacterized protein LOC132209065 isoform X1 n=1 Tax=Stegostoma tigrinum TaxID=3053191 RepID=UPI00286FE636|nr:uncharacterized protein LOC132209065 isoform X1 [Stegostoma tigrinum]